MALVKCVKKQGIKHEYHLLELSTGLALPPWSIYIGTIPKIPKRIGGNVCMYVYPLS